MHYPCSRIARTVGGPPHSQSVDHPPPTPAALHLVMSFLLLLLAL